MRLDSAFSRRVALVGVAAASLALVVGLAMLRDCRATLSPAKNRGDTVVEPGIDPTSLRVAFAAAALFVRRTAVNADALDVVIKSLVEYQCRIDGKVPIRWDVYVLFPDEKTALALWCDEVWYDEDRKPEWDGTLRSFDRSANRWRD